MSELVQSHERRWACAAGTAAICIAIALVLGLSTLAVFATYDANQGRQRGDDELRTNFLSHEAAFAQLVQMLVTDYPSPAAEGAPAIDWAAMASADKNAVRLEIYRHLLQQISVADLRYFPDSGKLVLVPDGEENPERPSESYLYLPHAQPQSFVQHHGYYWRGPGVEILTGDLRLKGAWFIRHDMTIEVALTPY